MKLWTDKLRVTLLAGSVHINENEKVKEIPSKEDSFTKVRKKSSETLFSNRSLI